MIIQIVLFFEYIIISLALPCVFADSDPSLSWMPDSLSGGVVK